MPRLSDIPGTGLVAETTKRLRGLAAGAGGGVAAIGGPLLKRVLDRGTDGKKGADADPIAETPAAPPGAAKPIPEPKAAAPKPRAVAPKPKPAKPKDARPKPKPAKPDPPKPKAGASKSKAAKQKSKSGKPKAAKPKPAPPKTTGTDAPPKPEFEPGNISGDKDPHHALNNPVVDPDETEYPDPFDKRDDPRDPADPDGMSFGEEPHSPTGAVSTSEPHPGQDPEAGDRAEPPKREKLDD
jgi:hypothetical protein